MEETELVTSIDEVIINVKQFNKDLEEGTNVVSQLTMFKHWYYISSLGMFGPSKYIGYKNMNTSRYNRGKGKTGIDTERVLTKWFIKLPTSSKEENKYMDKLIGLLNSYEKKVRSNSCIHILK
ncbi:hypothetical protein [Virgibacillus sp. L01]|uniref:hypothetical protein n=1 Tax=Virgibacillus sp. L01 TaxID=3457429 RepID=UPI003FD40E25